MLSLRREVAEALNTGKPVVALESALITHGFDFPDNLQIACEMEEEVRHAGAIPATIAALDGEFHIGLSREQLELISQPSSEFQKISSRDIGITVALHHSGGMTVAASLCLAHQAGIRVFATGGIGGVHRENPRDVSADLVELGRRPLVVVSSGVKAILDIPATLEYLETLGVPVVGYRTTEFPAFFALQSGCNVDCTASTPEEVTEIAKSHWQQGFSSSILIGVPPPVSDAVDPRILETWLLQARQSAESDKMTGRKVTPYQLAKLRVLSGGMTTNVNKSLLRNNARQAALMAVAFCS